MARSLLLDFLCRWQKYIRLSKKRTLSTEGLFADGNVITGIGMFFREFAETVLQRFDYDIGNNFMREKPEDYTEEELTFYWSEEDYREFLEELKEYQQ